MCLEKDVAAETLGGLFESTGNHFLPYVEDCTVELVSQLTHYYEGIRKTSLKSLLAIIRTMYESSDPPGWQTGLENVSKRTLSNSWSGANTFSPDPSVRPNCQDADWLRFATVV